MANELREASDLIVESAQLISELTTKLAESERENAEQSDSIRAFVSDLITKASNANVLSKADRVRTESDLISNIKSASFIVDALVRNAGGVPSLGRGASKIASAGSAARGGPSEADQLWNRALLGNAH